MSSSKRTKDLDSSSESESKSSSSSLFESDNAKPAPKPNQSYRPLQVSGVGALSSAQPSTTFKRTTNTPRQPSNMKTKPNVPLASRDTSIVELASRNKAKDRTVMHGSDDDGSSLPESPFSPTRQKMDNCPIELSDNEPKHLHTAAGRTKARLERDVNTVRSEFEGHQARVDKRLERMEDRQARFKKQQDLLLEKIDVLIDQSKEAPEPKRSIIKDEKPASTVYFATAKNIQSRRDRDKTVENIPSKHKPHAVAHTRKVAKAGLGGVTKLTSSVPGFYYKHGQPDFFPAQFTSNDGYCKPYAHWDKLFSDNHHWFAAFITLWRSMIPQDGSEFAAVCKKFTERQILVLLHNGPFSSLSQAWKRENDPEQAEGSKPEKNAKKRGTGRVDSKTFKRQQYWSKIPQVAGPGWDAAWVRQVMSPENTDDERGKQIERAQWKPEWFNDMFGGIDGNLRKRELAKPGVHRPLPRRTVELVDTEPPVIYSGKGENKKLVLYPRAMLSKRWRKTPKGAAWMKASAHSTGAQINPENSGALTRTGVPRAGPPHPAVP